MLSHTDPGTVPLGSQIHGAQPWDHPSDGIKNNMRKHNRFRPFSRNCHNLRNKVKTRHPFNFNNSNYAVSHGTLMVFSYSGGVNSCCSSCGHSWYTVCPPPPLGMGIVRSTYHTHPLAQCHGCHTHKADSPGSYAAPGCGNHDDKYHRDGLPHVPKRRKKQDG